MGCDTRDRHVDCMRQGVLWISMNNNLEGSRRFKQVLPESQAAVTTLLMVALGDARGRTKADNRMSSQGAGTQPLFLATSEHQGSQRWAVAIPLPAKESPDSFGTKNLMCADAYQIDPGQLQQLKLFTKPLGGINVEPWPLPGQS